MSLTPLPPKPCNLCGSWEDITPCSNCKMPLCERCAPRHDNFHKGNQRPGSGSTLGDAGWETSHRHGIVPPVDSTRII
jgi:hypothetical protein